METVYINQKTTSGIVSPLFTVGNTLICANSVAGLEDCTITTPAVNQTIVYDSATSKWVNKLISFGSDLTDVSITNPQPGERIMWDLTLSKWINTTPRYYTINIWGKLKNSALDITGTNFNLLDSANYDVYNETISNSGFTNVGNQITGFRNIQTPMMISLDVTLSINSVINLSNFIFGYQLNNGGGGFTYSMNTLNNPSKSISYSGIFSTNLVTITSLFPYLGLSSTTFPQYVGNPDGDISFSLSFFEI
jgi:hypothetical protein